MVVILESDKSCFKINAPVLWNLLESTDCLKVEVVTAPKGKSLSGIK